MRIGSPMAALVLYSIGSSSHEPTHILEEGSEMPSLDGSEVLEVPHAGGDRQQPVERPAEHFHPPSKQSQHPLELL